MALAPTHHIATQSKNVKVFDINTTCLLATYKDAGLTRAEIIGRITGTRGLFGLRCIVGEEVGSTGYKHFHVYISTYKKHRWTMEQLDFIGGTHGHYKRVDTTPEKVIAYVTKDNSFDAYPTEYMKLEIKDAIVKYGGHPQVLKMDAKMYQNFHLKGRNFKRK